MKPSSLGGRKTGENKSETERHIIYTPFWEFKDSVSKEAKE